MKNNFDVAESVAAAVISRTHLLWFNTEAEVAAFELGLSYAASTKILGRGRCSETDSFWLMVSK